MQATPVQTFRARQERPAAADKVSDLARRPLRVIAAAAQDPLLRNGHTLTVSAGVNGLLGLAYWSLAAHRYDTAAVGEGSAAISALMLITGVAQLNLMSMLMRFVPTQGARSRRLVLGAYAMSVVLAVALSVTFIAVAGHLSPGLRFFSSSRLLEVGFVLATALGSVSMLQDAALTALHRPEWVVVENAAMAVTKLVLVVGLAVALPRSGILLSWAGGLVLSVIVANVYLFVKPLRRGKEQEVTEEANLADLARYVAPDYLGELLWLAVIAGLPLVVIARIGATDYAYFGVAWTATYFLYQAAGNLGYSLLVESALRPEAVAELWMRVIRHMAPLLVAAVTVLVVAAPWVLAPFGAAYSAHGTTVFRLLAISAIPGLITSTMVHVARAQRRTWLGLAALGTLCGGVLVGSIVLLPFLGADAVGVSWLVSQTVVAAGLLVWRNSWLPGRRFDLRATDAAAPTRGAGVSPPARPVPLHAEGGHIPPIDVIVGALGIVGAERSDVELQSLSHSAQVRSVAILVDQRPVAVAKRALTEGGAAALAQEAEALRRLRRSLARTDLLGLVAEPRWLEDRSGNRCLVQPWLPGANGAALAGTRSVPVTVLVTSALTTLGRLHSTVGEMCPADGPATIGWLEESLATLESLGNGLTARHRRDQVHELRAALFDRLSRARTLIGVAHNDLWLGNVLFDRGMLSGIIGWTQARADIPLAVDSCTLGLTTWAASTGRSVGEVTTRALQAGGWTTLVGGHLGIPLRSLVADSGLGETTVALLAWLQHVTANLDRSGRYRDNPLWVHDNVDRVLAAGSWGTARRGSATLACRLRSPARMAPAATAIPADNPS